MTTTGASAATPGETPEHSAIADGAVPVSADSPFPDGYDIASERDALADLIAAANPDEADPRWSRFILLCEREAQLQTMKPTRKPRQPAQKIVPAPVARGVPELGRLVDEGNRRMHKERHLSLGYSRPPGRGAAELR